MSIGRKNSKNNFFLRFFGDLFYVFFCLFPRIRDLIIALSNPVLDILLRMVYNVNMNKFIKKWR